MSEYKRQILIGGAVAFVLGVIAIAGAFYLPLAINGGTSTSVPTPEQTTFQTTSTSMTTRLAASSSTTQFVASPETVETTNSTLGLELSLSISSSIVPSQDSFVVSASLFNTLSTVNNLTASSNWPVQNLLSGSCDSGNGTLTPEGISIFTGNYGRNNISSASPINFWAGVECLDQPDMWKVNGLASFTSFAFLPKNDSGYFGFNASGPVSRGIIPAQMNTGNVSIWSSNDSSSLGINSLGSASPDNYTLVAGDEWGQMLLLHFQVVASNNLPIMGLYITSVAGCSLNGNPWPCTTDYLSGAVVFNCASEAATTSGCTQHVLPAGYTITIWYPYNDQPNEPLGANCKASVVGNGAYPYFGGCISINSTAFVFGYSHN